MQQLIEPHRAAAALAGGGDHLYFFADLRAVAARQAAGAKLRDGLCRLLLRIAVEIEKIAVFAVQIGIFAVVDGMGVGYNGAFLRLAENFIEDDGGKAVRVDEIAQNISRADGRELIGIAEYPYDGSWGYQVTGYYAPTARFGSPKEFKYLVNYLHKNKIGVILDWVPAHFPKDAHGLAEFDGTCIYEHSDPRQGEHPDWGTKIFNYGKNEVKNFLIANALYWIEEFHVDGLRVDAVASMLYLDYGKKDGQWIANKYGGNENLEAIEFFKHLNTLILGRNKGTMMIAEESTAWPKVTGDVEKENGLGFTFKWNMGWMHDFLEYMKLDPYFRKFNHNKMTFSMTYAFSEEYILVLSHDEVVHLKCSMINKMPGEYDDKFENLKAGYSFMMGHPGKKLLFMGQEFGQFQEWSEARELDWYLLREARHQQLQDYVRDLQMMYKKYPALYADANGYDGFQWINANDADRSIYSFIRWSPTKRNNLLFVCNFTPVERKDYWVGVPQKKQCKLILSSADPAYGGQHHVDNPVFKPVKGECDGQPYHVAYPLAPYEVAVFAFN